MRRSGDRGRQLIRHKPLPRINPSAGRPAKYRRQSIGGPSPAASLLGESRNTTCRNGFRVLPAPQAGRHRLCRRQTASVRPEHPAPTVLAASDRSDGTTAQQACPAAFLLKFPGWPSNVRLEPSREEDPASIYSPPDLPAVILELFFSTILQARIQGWPRTLVYVRAAAGCGRCAAVSSTRRYYRRPRPLGRSRRLSSGLPSSIAKTIRATPKGSVSKYWSWHPVSWTRCHCSTASAAPAEPSAPPRRCCAGSWRSTPIPSGRPTS